MKWGLSLGTAVAAYEGEHNASEVQTRRQAYWSVLCGGFGHVMGNHRLDLSDPGWQQAMELAGSVGMQIWGQLFHSRSWYDLIPDQKHEVVKSGLGEFNGLDYLAAAKTPDGSTVIAYMPTSRTINVDMSKIAGSQNKAWWFDPRNGKAAAAGIFPASGTHEFPPPGEGDWVLVLDDSAKQLPTPGGTQ